MTEYFRIHVYVRYREGLIEGGCTLVCSGLMYFIIGLRVEYGTIYVLSMSKHKRKKSTSRSINQTSCTTVSLWELKFA